jgi:hypothetical protein
VPILDAMGDSNVRRAAEAAEESQTDYDPAVCCMLVIWLPNGTTARMLVRLPARKFRFAGSRRSRPKKRREGLRGVTSGEYQTNQCSTTHPPSLGHLW